jgi:hypothetical protein
MHSTALDDRARRVRLAISLLTLAGILAARATADAQERDTSRAAPRGFADTAGACSGERISAVDIRPEPPRLIGRSAPAWSRGALHVLLGSRTTRPEVAAAFLQLEEGEACTEGRRAESERLLRAQPFLADAFVRAEPDDAGGTKLVVETVDEIPAVAGLRVSDGEPRLVKLGNSNVWGSGQYLSVAWQQGDAFRDGVSVRYEHYHLLGAPRRLTINLERAPLGDDYSIALGRPFLTEYQRGAWFVELRDAQRYVRFVRNGERDARFPVDRRFWSGGGVMRIGGRGLGTFAGALLTHERLDPAPDGIIVTDSGAADDPGGQLAGRYETVRRTRAGAVLGVRMLDYLTVHGFEALEGRQDLARGVQIATVVGRGIANGDDDPFLSADVYAGAGTRKMFLGSRVRWEGRRDDGDWTDVVTNATAAWWWKASARRTVSVSGEFAGAWRSDVPFQLRLGARNGGVRGYDGSRVGGARLLVLRAEQRWRLAAMGRWMTTGAALFADAGKTWAGDSPYGESTIIRPSVGVALLAAVPRESRRVVRLEAAVPLASDPDAARWELRFAVTRAGRRFSGEPGGLSDARAASPATAIFRGL